MTLLFSLRVISHWSMANSWTCLWITRILFLQNIAADSLVTVTWRGLDKKRHVTAQMKSIKSNKVTKPNHWSLKTLSFVNHFTAHQLQLLVHVQSKNVITACFLKPIPALIDQFLQKLVPECSSVWAKTEWEETWKWFSLCTPNYSSFSISKNKFTFHKASLLRHAATLPNCLRAIRCHFDHGYLAKGRRRERREREKKSISPNYLCWRSSQSRWPQPPCILAI